MSRYKEYKYVNHSNKEAVQIGNIKFEPGELLLETKKVDTLLGISTYVFKTLTKRSEE